MNSIQIASAFGAGFLASLSPCVYPLVPVTLGFIGSQSAEKTRYKTKLSAFLFGQVLVMTLLGVITVSLGETLGFTSEDPRIRLGVGLILLLFGVFSLVGRLPAFFDRFNTKAQALTSGLGSSVLGAFLLGVGASLIASPCTTPILSSILALIASSQTLLSGAFLMFSYALGFVAIFAVLGFGILRTRALPSSGVWMSYVHKFSGILLLAAGIYYLYQGVQSL